MLGEAVRGARDKCKEPGDPSWLAYQLYGHPNVMSFHAGTSESEYLPIVLHQFGHSLGLIHEFQNPAGGIKWNKEAVYNFFTNPPYNWSKEEINHGVFERYSRAITNRTRFDSSSIMLYSIPDEFFIEPYEIPMRSSLSETDKDIIKTIYPFSQQEKDIDSKTTAEPNKEPNEAIEILRIQFAKGQISENEFLKKYRILKSSP